jgi:O-antigen/teichoic acid export membrane protein
VSKLQIGRGAVYLYIENISSMLFGYAFWFILSRITTPEVVGISSSLISIATMFTAIAAVGVPLGAQRTYDVRILLKQASKKSMLRFMESFKGLLKASVASWIPLSIETIGAQLGTIVVLGIEGPTQAGFYFIAFQISMGILSVIWALEGTTYPALFLYKRPMDAGTRRGIYQFQLAMV